MSKTLVEKIWEQHVAHAGQGDEPDLLYVDLHLVHEVTSPQAFDGLRLAGRKVRRPDLTLAVMDHNVPTDPRQVSGELPIEALSQKQMDALATNAEEFGVRLFAMGSHNNGIVHIVGPELGMTQPGCVIVCGDSHTATHGAFGAIAFGIGTSDVEHVLATQTLPQRRPKTLLVDVTGERPVGTTAKDLILHILSRLGNAGGTGHIVEYRGDAITALSMEERMTVCNMSIEGGARAGLIAPDETTFAYLKDRPHAPRGADWDDAIAAWHELHSDADASFDTVLSIDATLVTPTVTWGTTPDMSVPITGSIPTLDDAPDDSVRRQWERMYAYMGVEPGQAITDLAVDRVFIGSCTNGRLSDLRAAAEVLAGRSVAAGVTAIVVPGSGLVKAAAEAEGLDKVFTDAGFEWREPGCSMCLGMNSDYAGPKERVASTSNRNFEGRQGFKARTHLLSPAMAAAAAVTGHLTDVRDLTRQA